MLSDGRFFRWFVNSIAIATIVTLSNVFFDSLVGYTLAKFEFRGRYLVFIAILSTLMIPTEMLVIPWYIMARNFGWLDTYWGIMFPGMMTAFGTFLMKQFFETVPKDFIEAARIDGLNEFTIWWRIAMPLVTPALSALAIFTFLGNWTAFIWPLIVTTSKELYTVPVGLSSFAVEQADPVGDDHDGREPRDDPDASRLPRAAALHRARRRAGGAQGMTMNPDHPPHEDLRSSDRSVFPDPTYKETVLRPLFEGAKAHHVDGFRRIDRAHLVMLAETGILKLDDAKAIARALVAIDREIDPATLVYTGEVEDFFFLIEAELRRRLGPDLAGRLHTGRSRNDIDHTLFKLALKAASTISPRACAVWRQPSSTWPDASAIRLSSPIRTASPRSPTRSATTSRQSPNACCATSNGSPQRGASSISRRWAPPQSPPQGFPLDRQRMAQLLGFAAPLENSYGCIASVDYVTATYGAVELIFLHLGRPIQDLQFWTSFEVGQVYVPNAFVQISSIMPQKRNPVPIEHLRHLASQTVGRARAMLDVVHNTPFTDMNDSEGETQETGYGAFASAARVLDLLMALLPALQIDSRRVADNIRRSCITVTELADSLVRIEGLSFREAHEIAAAVARAVVARDGNLPTDGYEPFAASFLEATKRTVDDRQQAFCRDRLARALRRRTGPFWRTGSRCARRLSRPLPCAARRVGARRAVLR